LTDYPKKIQTVGKEAEKSVSELIKLDSDIRRVKESVHDTLFKVLDNNEEIIEFIKRAKGLNEMYYKIKDLKDRLLDTLKELEAYEILPGVCKYLTGSE